MEQNKTGKYFKYAIGEIILVVIGILIALSINNWNENKKTEVEEVKLLTNIHVDLQKTLEELESALEFNKSTIDEIIKIEYYSKNELPYSDELNYSFGVLPYFYASFITNSSYKSLQATGLGILKNDLLKDKIVTMYDVDLENILDYNQDENQSRSDIVAPFYAKNLRYLDKSVYDAKPNNYGNLIEDAEFLNILSLIKRQRNRGVEKFENVITPLKNLIDELNTELNSRRKL
jgi:hypothetical protein